MMVHVQREELDESWCSESYKVIDPSMRLTPDIQIVESVLLAHCIFLPPLLRDDGNLEDEKK